MEEGLAEVASAMAVMVAVEAAKEVVVGWLAAVGVSVVPWRVQVVVAKAAVAKVLVVAKAKATWEAEGAMAGQEVAAMAAGVMAVGTLAEKAVAVGGVAE